MEKIETQSTFLKLREEIKLRSQHFVIMSGSMCPLISVGDWIEVEELKESPRRFDILVFFNGERFICHFLWHINASLRPDGSKSYVTSGLGSWPHEDLPVSSKQILGKVVSHEIGFFTRLKLYFIALKYKIGRSSKRRRMQR